MKRHIVTIDIHLVDRDFFIHNLGEYSPSPWHPSFGRLCGDIEQWLSEHDLDPEIRLRNSDRENSLGYRVVADLSFSTDQDAILFKLAFETTYG